MAPSSYVFLDALPRTATGKPDRQQLPLPERSRVNVPVEYAAPRNATEAILTAVWEKVLGIEVIGVHDSFLELGGDPNYRDNVDATPLLRAAGNCDSVAVVKALIAAGADVNAKAKGGGTPLMIAEAMKCAEIAKILREAGAK